MFNRFTKAARAIATGATEIARDLGAPMVEAEHLLLAATRLDTPAAATLRAAGLDYDGLLDALEAETARSLAAVGVTASTPRFSPFVRAPRFAASAKLALERSLKVALARKDNFIGPEQSCSRSCARRRAPSRARSSAQASTAWGCSSCLALGDGKLAHPRAQPCHRPANRSRIARERTRMILVLARNLTVSLHERREGEQPRTRPMTAQRIHGGPLPPPSVLAVSSADIP